MGKQLKIVWILELIKIEILTLYLLYILNTSMAQPLYTTVTTNPYALRKPVVCPYGGNWYYSLRVPSYCVCTESIRNTEAWKHSIRNQCETGFHRCADFKEKSTVQIGTEPSVVLKIDISFHENPDSFVAHTVEETIQISDAVGLLVRR